tara:strand:+ start:305 stop:496 length:192 start_codon:yes stop_codon:yes gene_type:complete
MFDDPVKRCGTQTTMAAPDSLFTLNVSISPEEALMIDLVVGEDVHIDDVMELLAETIEYLQQS